jgi:hypothetical protein
LPVRCRSDEALLLYKVAQIAELAVFHEQVYLLVRLFRTPQRDDIGVSQSPKDPYLGFQIVREPVVKA